MLINRSWRDLIEPKICKQSRSSRCAVFNIKESGKSAHIGPDLLSRLSPLENSQVPYSGDFKTTITLSNHFIMADWLVEVSLEYGLSDMTLALMSNLMNRFLVADRVDRMELQLLGVTCMWMASSLQDELTPSVSDFVWITDDAYTVEELRKMERRVLAALRPTLKHNEKASKKSIVEWIPLDYINIIVRLPDFASNDDLRCVVSFLHDLVLHQPDCLTHAPDMLAAAICYAALAIVAPILYLKFIDQGTIAYVLMCTHDDEFCDEELFDLIRKILRLPSKAFKSPAQWDAVLTKYKQPSRKSIVGRFFVAISESDHEPILILI